jgi:poly(beta-D-mannuronate) lyase
MISRIALAWFIGVSFAGPLAAAETIVKNIAEFDAAVKSAKPGDQILLADGEWRDAKLVVRCEGTESKSIVIRAATLGRVVLTGKSTLRIGGRHTIVGGLKFRDVTADDEVIAFRIDPQTLAKRCRLSECAVVGDRPADGDRTWVGVYGHFNYVEACRFDGKRSAGAIVCIHPIDSMTDGNHEIAHNYFGPRQKPGRGSGEIIRIGDAASSKAACASIVKWNYFYRCDGDADVISNQATENHYVGNWFVGCAGTLTLRRGSWCDVGENKFFGDGRPGTGGIRTVRNG